MVKIFNKNETVYVTAPKNKVVIKGVISSVHADTGQIHVHNGKTYTVCDQFIINKCYIVNRNDHSKERKATGLYMICNNSMLYKTADEAFAALDKELKEKGDRG
jgi:glucose dehydrogenase